MASTPKTILHVTFDMGIGGTEQVIRQLVRQLDPAEFKCEIACIDGKIGALGEQLAKDGTPLHSYPRQPGFDRGLIRWLRKLIKSRHIDIVHAHQYSPYSYAWFAHWGLGVKLVFTEHGRFHPDRYRTKARWLNPVMARTTDHLVAISSATRDALVEYEYLPKNRIDIIYNGIAPLQVSPERQVALRQQLGLNPGEKVIGTVARLDKVKNQPLMLKATRRLLDTGHRVRLLLVGDGPERAALEAEAKALNLDTAVLFTGFQTEPAAYLSLMDIFLLPSFTEGTSMTLLEAMSLGIPTVATRVGGTPEIVAEGDTGLLVESDDLPAFTQAISTILNDDPLHQRICTAARHVFEKRFSATAMTNSYTARYRKNLK